MASSLARLRSGASTFHGLDIARPILRSISARLHSSGFSGERSDGLPVKATSVDFGGETVVRLKSTYMDIIVPLLIQEFNYKNPYQVPKIEKVVVKCGTGGGTQAANGLKTAMAELTLITGQSPVKKKATKEITSYKSSGQKSLYKIKEGQALGASVTLRGNVMYSFLDRFINRLMEFQEVKPRYDGKGSYSISFGEQCLFPEISTDLLGASQGMVVRITTTAKTDLETYKLLGLMGLPCKAVPKKKA